MLVFAVATPLLAERDRDQVVLRNGDHLTGEIQQLDRAELTFKTDAIGTLSIDWGQVRSIESPNRYDVELQDGSRHLGTLASGGEDVLAVIHDAQTDRMPLAAVVRIRRIQSSFWRRLDGSFGVGANYTSADSSLQWNVSAQARTRKLNVERELAGNWVETQRQKAPRTRRSELTWTQMNLLAERRLFLFAGKLQQNDELGVDLRGLALAAYGNRFVWTNHTRVSGVGGLAYNVEDFAGEEAIKTSVEAVLGFEYELFESVALDRDVTFQLLSFRDIGGEARYRFEASANVVFELVKDFGLRLEVLDSYDSRPPAEASSKSDIAAIASLVWTY